MNNLNMNEAVKKLVELGASGFSESFFQLIEKSQDIFWIRSADFKTLYYINQSVENVWGTSCQEIYDHPTAWIDAILPSDKNAVLANFNKQPIKGEQYFSQFRILRPDQHVRTIKDVSFPLFNEQGECIAYAGVSKDVTHNHARIGELEEASRFFRLLAERIQSVFWIRDTKCNKQIYVSPSYEKVWGKSRQRLYDEPDAWIETLLPEDRNSDPARMRVETLQSSINPQEVQYENRYRIQRPDGEIRWIKDVSFPIFDEKDEFLGFAGIAEDITSTVLHDQELKEAKERAEMSNQAKANFLAMMSHELRTPLNAVLGMAQVMRMKGLTKELDECVSVIVQSGNNLLALVNDILDFAKLEVGKLSFSNEPLDLSILVSQVVHSFAPQVNEKGIELKLDYQINAPNLVIGDAKRVRQILINLLGNAIKFTDRGVVKLQVACVSKTLREATFCFKVTDTGIGISQENLDFIFEKFSQVESSYDRKQKGTGLGLAITKELVEKMGGEIEVASELGKGSEFSFNLTFSLQRPSLEKPVNIKDDAKWLGEQPEKCSFNLNILLVEDNSINQRIAKIMLEEVGCRVDIIDNGREVLDRMQQANQYDLIFMDIGLPDISGLDVVSALRKQPELKKIPIIAMTAHILDQDKQQCFSVGMNGIIVKPISHNEIIKTLKEWVPQEVK